MQRFFKNIREFHKGIHQERQLQKPLMEQTAMCLVQRLNQCVYSGIWKLDGCPSRRLLLYLCVLSFVFKISHLFASNESDFIIFQIAVKIDQSNISISVNKSEKNCDKKFPSDRIQDGWTKCL